MYLVYLGNFRVVLLAYFIMVDEAKGLTIEPEILMQVGAVGTSILAFVKYTSRTTTRVLPVPNEAKSMSTAFYAALDWMLYLHHPPPASWVARTAATFRVLALLLILPCVFLTALVSLFCALCARRVAPPLSSF